MPYIKKKKIWKKVLSKEETDMLWEICEDALPQNLKERLDDSPYIDIISQCKFVHPETDIADGTAGITPKQARFLIDSIGFDNIKRVFSILNNSIDSTLVKQRELNLDPEEYSTNLVLWKFVFRDKIIPLLKDGKKNVAMGKLLLESEVPADIVNKYKFEDEVYKAYFKNEIIREEFIQMDEQNLISNTKPLLLKDVKMEGFWEERENIWKDLHGFIPKIKSMLLLEPEYWDKNLFLGTLDYFFGVKQLNKIDEEMRDKYISLYKIFGHNIVVIKNILKEKKVLDNNTLEYLNSLPELYVFNEGVLKAFEKIINLSKRGFYFDFTLEELATILATISLEKGLSDYVIKKENLTYIEFKEFILDQKSTVLAYAKQGKISTLQTYDFKTSALFKKYDVPSNTREYINALYAKTAHIKTILPLYKEDIENYTVELVDKDDIRGLIAGDATNCCQRVTQAFRPNNYGGCSSVYYGAEEKDSSFLLISKNDRIVAQSWVWLYKGVLCFDSLESLGGEPSSKIFDCYEAYAEYALLNCKDIDVVTMGAIHGGNSNAKNYKRVENPVYHSYAYDSRNVQYEIARRSKKHSVKEVKKDKKESSFDDFIKTHNLKTFTSGYSDNDIELPYVFDLLFDVKCMGQLHNTLIVGDGIHPLKDIEALMKEHFIDEDVIREYIPVDELEDDIQEEYENELEEFERMMS